MLLTWNVADGHAGGMPASQHNGSQHDQVHNGGEQQRSHTDLDGAGGG